MELNFENFSRSKSFNMVNMHNKHLLSLGLEPTIIKLNPLYINRKKEIFYIESIPEIFWHKECILNRDVIKFLDYMRKIKKSSNGISAQTILENYYTLKCQEIIPYKDEHELSGIDIKVWLNHNANIFLNRKCSYGITDAYNKDTLDLINTLLETKREIYESLYSLFKLSNDYEKTVKELLISMRHFHPSFFEESQCVEDSFMNLPEDNENKGYYKMLLKASEDILVQFIGLDKIESQLSQVITTSKPNIYEEFFNLIITGWSIIQLPRVLFDETSQTFRLINPNNYINLGKNREYEEEAKWILKRVPYDQRTKYLKS